MDTAKAIAALIKNPGNPLNFRGFDKLKNKGVPCFLIPTTAGTGSEVTHNASFVDEKENIKMGINGKNLFAYKSILDGEVTVSCPKKALSGSAVDALVHTLEAYVSKKSNFLVCLNRNNIRRTSKIYGKKIIHSLIRHYLNEKK